MSLRQNDGDELITVSEAAARLDIGQLALLEHVNRGDLHGTRVWQDGRQQLRIPASEVERLRRAYFLRPNEHRAWVERKRKRELEALKRASTIAVARAHVERLRLS